MTALLLTLTACEYEIPADYCADLLDYLDLLRMDAAEVCEEYAATTTTSTTTTTTVVPAPTTSVPPQDICDRVHGIPERTLRWCPLVAINLAKWAALTLDNLQHNLAIVDCESKGDPNAKNPNSSATGLYQHIDTFRNARALRWGVGIVDDWTLPGPNIATGVALYVHGGPSHWPNCGRR